MPKQKKNSKQNKNKRLKLTLNRQKTNSTHSKTLDFGGLAVIDLASIRVPTYAEASSDSYDSDHPTQPPWIHFS